jgi:hypothetical protein
MEEQKIVKNQRWVEFTLADDSVVKGVVFLSLYEAHRPGPQRVGELLNGQDTFLPIKTGDGTLHLNIDNIIEARTSEEEELHELMMLGRKYRVEIITLGGKKIAGDVFVDLPQESSRVSDFLNQPRRFFPLIASGGVIYVARRFILSAKD